MSNRYQVDPHFRFRAVLSLDDDILMPCSDVEHAFARWRENPDLIVGWYPRLAEGQVYKEGGEWRKRWWYRGEPAAIADGQYNLVLTGAAFLDTRAALPAYWAPQLEEARALVDRLQNCDDLLMNFVVANLTLAAGQGRNASLLPQAVQYMRPSRRIDVSWASGVGLSHAVQHFIDDAEECLGKFSEIFGEVKLRSEVFEWSGTTQPSCSSRDVLQCSYLSD